MRPEKKEGNCAYRMCIIKLAEKYLTRQNSAMSGQNSVCLDTMTEQCVKVIFGSALTYTTLYMYGYMYMYLHVRVYKFAKDCWSIILACSHVVCRAYSLRVWGLSVGN